MQHLADGRAEGLLQRRSEICASRTVSIGRANRLQVYFHLGVLDHIGCTVPQPGPSAEHGRTARPWMRLRGSAGPTDEFPPVVPQPVDPLSAEKVPNAGILRAALKTPCAGVEWVSTTRTT
jgi:hypothetical protein